MRRTARRIVVVTGSTVAAAIVFVVVDVVIAFACAGRRGARVVERGTGRPVAEPRAAGEWERIVLVWSTVTGSQLLCRLPSFLAYLERVSLAAGDEMDAPESAVRIGSFVADYDVDLADLDRDLASFRSLNEFFARPLRHGARPITAPDDPSVAVSPTDGRVLCVSGDASTVLQIKGRAHDVAGLLGVGHVDPPRTARPRIDRYDQHRRGDDRPDDHQRHHDRPDDHQRHDDRDDDRPDDDRPADHQRHHARRDDRPEERPGPGRRHDHHRRDDRADDRHGHDGRPDDVTSTLGDGAARRRVERFVRELAGDGFTAAICRLAPGDYHRFHWPVDGHWRRAELLELAGEYHSVATLAVTGPVDVLGRNRRTVAIVETAAFGEVAVVAVGAVKVGSIDVTSPTGAVRKGDEMGRFRYGGSTVVVVAGRGRIEWDAELVNNSERGVETLVRMGTELGRAGDSHDA